LRQAREREDQQAESSKFHVESEALWEWSQL
jgi:hypothetical protein